MTLRLPPSVRQPTTAQRVIIAVGLAAAMMVAILALGPRVRRAVYLNRASLAVARGYALDTGSIAGTPPQVDPAAADDALRFAQALLELDGDDAAAWRQLGRALWLAGDAVQAEAALEQALHANPQDLHAGDALAALHAATGQIDLAVSEWRKWGYPARLVALGERLAQEQRWPEAVAAYEAAMAASPRHVEVYYGLGWARYRMGDVSGAQAAFFTAREVDPRSPWPYVSIGDLYAAEGRLDEALPWYEGALEVAPREPGLRGKLAEVYANRGIQLLQAGLRGQAEAAFRRALEFDPENAEAQQQLSTLTAPP